MLLPCSSRSLCFVLILPVRVCRCFRCFLTDASSLSFELTCSESWVTHLHPQSISVSQHVSCGGFEMLTIVHSGRYVRSLLSLGLYKSKLFIHFWAVTIKTSAPRRTEIKPSFSNTILMILWSQVLQLYESTHYLKLNTWFYSHPLWHNILGQVFVEAS